MTRTDYDATISHCGQQITIRDALSLARIPWAALVDAGADLRQIRDEAALYGDFALTRKATRAMAHRGWRPC